IVHARWNSTIIDPLVAGAKAKLLECGVKESNVVVQSCPGSWELPFAVQRCVVPLPLSPLLCPPRAREPCRRPSSSSFFLRDDRFCIGCSLTPRRRPPASSPPRRSSLPPRAAPPRPT